MLGKIQQHLYSIHGAVNDSDLFTKKNSFPLPLTLSLYNKLVLSINLGLGRELEDGLIAAHEYYEWVSLDDFSI